MATDNVAPGAKKKKKDHVHVSLASSLVQSFRTELSLQLHLIPLGPLCYPLSQ